MIMAARGFRGFGALGKDSKKSLQNYIKSFSVSYWVVGFKA